MYRHCTSTITDRKHLLPIKSFFKLEFHPQMAYSSFNMNQGDVIQPSLPWGSYEYERVLTNGNHFPSDVTFYGCPFFNSSGYHQEGSLQAIISSSPCMEEKPGFPTSPWNNTLETESYDGERQPYEGCRNWLSNCNSVLNGCWEDKYGSLGNGSNNNSENMESSNACEEQCGNNSFTRRDDEYAENYPATSDYYPWPCCDSWFAYGQENVSLAYSEEETNVAYERVLRDAGVYEGIFGYWPCLYRRHWNIRNDANLNQQLVKE